MGIVRFRNDHIAAITGYRDYVQGNLTICHVYYVEGLGHNLFLVGQFCDGDLEVAFRSKTCYVRNLEGDDLLIGSRDSNLYTISISKMAASFPVCLMSRVTSTMLGIKSPVTTEEKAQKQNDVKARSMLLMALPNEHLITFNQYKDAKTLFAATRTRFGESLDSIFNRLQKIVSELAILGENISQEDLNLKFLRSLPSKWNTHVVVWRNKPDLDTISFDDLHNNFKIVKQEVKGTASLSLSSSSQNMAFVSSPSSTNEVNTAYGVSTANTQVSLVSTQVSTASTQDGTANLSDATVYAFLASQPNGSQLKTGRKITINNSDTAGYDKSKVECFNCHKMGHFARECKGPRSQDSKNRNQDSSRRIIKCGRENSSKAWVAIDGAGFDWSDMADNEVPTNMALMGFLDSEPEFEGYRPKTSKSVSEDTSNKVRESPDALLVKELVTDDKLDKKTIFPTVAKIEFVRPKQQEKPVRKPLKYAKMYRSQGPRGNQRNWNNQKSQQLGSDFVMYNKACFVFRSFDHVQANCNYHQRPKAVNTARPNSAVVNAVRENQVNVVKASACWVWRRTKFNSASITLKRHNYVDGHLQKEDQGYVDSGCSRHMTRNMSYLSDFKEFDGGYVTFG
ncbi:ribonuclease H-like domain-containing protein [Tanacetum coccineum]